MKLLIVDDNQVNLKLLRAQLEVEGHEVVDASNGVEALRTLRGGPVGGVVSDILMPEMDGYRLCIEVRKDPALSGIPFVLYTSTYNSPADRQLAMQVGSDAYITKPAPAAEILAALKGAAGRHRGAQAAGAAAISDVSVLRQYSEALVRKLEEKNIELEKSLLRIGMVHEIDQAIIAAKTPEQIAEAVLPRLRDLLGMPRVVVNLFDLEAQEAEWLAAVGRQRSHVGPGVRYSLDIMGDVAALRRGEVQTVDVAALGARPEAKALLASDVRWFKVAPMIVGEELIGGLSFGGPSREFPADTIEIARQAAGQLAIAIHQYRLDERARLADAQYRLIFENVPVGVAMTSIDGRILSMNPALPRILGYDSVADAMAGLRGRTPGLYLDAGVRERYFEILRRDGAASQFEARLRRKDGSRVWVSMSGRTVDMVDGRISTVVTMIDDISLRKKQERRIARLNRVKQMQSEINTLVVRAGNREELFRETCRIAVGEGQFKMAWIGVVDRSSLKIVLGTSSGMDSEMRKMIEEGFSLGEDKPGSMTASAITQNRVLVANDIRSDPRVLFTRERLERGILSLAIFPLVVSGDVVAVLALCADEVDFFDADEVKLLTELTNDIAFAMDNMGKQERLEFLAYYDPLTGLPNRRLFHDRLSQNLHSRGNDARLVAVALLNLERFRRVNETAGRQAGDELLKQVGARLARMNETVARTDADVFALVFRGARLAAEVNRALETVVSACFSEPFQVNGESLRVSCRAGVAVFPGDGADADALMRNAEAAMRRSGSSERIVFYAPEMNARVAEAMATEGKLRRAVERREFVLHYQPKVVVGTGTIVGVEALIRWQEPGKGLVPPGLFIPILEETGMIVEVGRWAVEQAFADQSGWAAQGIQVPRVAVNVSAVQLQRKDFVDQLVDEIARGGDTPERLELEITESLVMRNVEDSIRKLSILRGMGVTIAVDDFGTGYSSLSYLGRLPVDTLKIDRSFINGIARSGDSTTLVTTVIALAHGLKLKVVAEGVETSEQANILRLFRCDEAQGYYYSRPVPAVEIEALLRSGKVLPAG